MFFWDLLGFILTALKLQNQQLWLNQIQQKQIIRMEDRSNKRVSIQNRFSNKNSSLNHHTSLQYRVSLFSKSSIFRRCSNSEIVQLKLLNKQEIFQLTYKFMCRLATDPTFVDQIFNDMKYESSDKTISITKLSSDDLQKQKSNNSIDSGSQTNTHSTPSLENIKLVFEKPNLQAPASMENKKQGKYHKVSIMMDSFSNFSTGSGSNISCSSCIHISSINFPTDDLNIEMVRRIFQEPESLLINLTMCLVLKFLFYSKIKITMKNASWILSIGAIVAYKIYYDEPVESLVQSFSEILEIKSFQILQLERYFLDQISFQAFITNQQYQLMLSKIVCN